MTKDPKHRFLSKLEQMAEELYRRGDSINHDEAWERQRGFLWGYGDAGKTINLVSAEEIQVVIDRAHERVYSESRENRITWDEGKPETATYACGACGSMWNDGHRIAAIRKGEWRTDEPFTRLI
jgi:hypothetical protein